MIRPKPRRFIPSNPDKYVGNVREIWSRSSWETRVMHYLDRNENVLSWASEEVAVPYVDPHSGKVRRYFPDFIARVRKHDGEVKTVVIEVKPLKETVPPKRKNPDLQRIVELNEAKWEAARRFCEDRGFDFEIVTERELGLVPKWSKKR